MAKRNAEPQRCGGARWFALLIVLSVVSAPLHAQETDSVGVIAFVSDMDGDNDIYLVNADGSNLRNLTNNDANDFSPSWSPDVSQIAFESNRDGPSSIYVMDSEGDNIQQLTSSDNFDFLPVWSPNGKLIAFMSSNGNPVKSMNIMDANGNNIHRVADVRYVHIYPISWSSDSKRLTFFSESYELMTTVWEMVLVDVVNDRATYTDHYAHWRFWSPDDTEIMFGVCGLYVMDADLTNQRPFLVNHEFSVSDDKALCLSTGGWSPDGQNIAFAAYFRGSDENKQAGLYIMDADGNNVRKLVDEQNVYSVAWSPDSRQIAYEGDEHIYVVDVQSGEITSITSGLSGLHVLPTWQPQPALMENN